MQNDSYFCEVCFSQSGVVKTARIDTESKISALFELDTVNIDLPHLCRIHQKHFLNFVKTRVIQYPHHPISMFKKVAYGQKE